MRKFRLCILRNENDEDHLLWVKACEDCSSEVEYQIIDLTAANWLEVVREAANECSCFLARPPGIRTAFKQLYDERVYIISEMLKLPLYPSPTEIYIYENKRFLYSWLKAIGLPHPTTKVFYSYEEAVHSLDNVAFPIVGKANIGASGSGVRILKNNSDARTYLGKVFSSSGIARRWGPNLDKGGLLTRGFHSLLDPYELKDKLQRYRQVRQDPQKGFVIFQEYIPHSFEWRVVAIGDSYFAHKKLKAGEKASGSLLKEYSNPPLYLLDFVRHIMTSQQFLSQAIDIFEVGPSKLLINEMQCIFGQSDSFQMLVNGRPGRYRFIDNRWAFEEGEFNRNESYNLRIHHILKILGG